MKKSFALLAGIFVLVSASAQHAFVPAGSDWRYLADGTDQTIPAHDFFLDDTSWPTGLAQLGYGDGDEVTVVPYGPDPNNKYITTYFRRGFWVTNAAQVSNLVLRLLIDDGAVAYINGVEVARVNMPAGPVTHTTLAALAAENTWTQHTLSPGAIMTGQNLLSVEVHQANANTSDMSFDAELIASTGPAGIAPRIVRQPETQTVIAGHTATFSIITEGSAPLFYRWRRNGLNLPDGTNATLTIPNVQTNHSGGVYSVIVSNRFGAALSSNAVLTVIPYVPQIRIVSPTNGAFLPGGQPIFIDATAFDDGTITSVEFFAGTNKIADATPGIDSYTAVWSNAPTGTHELRAVATDNDNNRGFSQATIHVGGPPVRPTITRHPESQTVFAGGTATFTVEATGTPPLFYRWRRNGFNFPGTNSALTIQNVQSNHAGTFSVIVSNSAGSVISSNALLTVVGQPTNIPPVANLITPTNGATFPVGAAIVLQATASDADGTVARVEFFANNTKVAEATSTSGAFSSVWSNAPAGTFQIVAQAVDNAGARGGSAPVQVVVGTSPPPGITLVSTGGVWRYLDNDSDQGTAWQTASFNDSTWASGLAQLGYGDGDEATVISFGPNATSKYITTYFRRLFGVTNASQVTNLVLRLLADDGAVAHINGVEVARVNMPAGPVSSLTTAVAAVEDVWMEIPLSPSVLINGPNILAVEVHQVNGASSDLSFDAALIGAGGGTGPTPPTIVSQPQSQTATIGSSVSFTVGVTGSEPLFYRWRRNGANIPGSSNAPIYTISSVQTNHAGVYSVIVSNSVGSRISSNALLTVVPPPGTNLPPIVNLLMPTNGTSLPSGAPVILQATASDPDGTVARVEFFAGTNRIAIALSSTGTFSTVWSNAPSGHFLISAVAVDNSGARTSSAAHEVIIGTGGEPTPVVLVPRGGVWRYLDDGSDLGSAWAAPAFDDSSWSAGPAQLGFGDFDETTLIRPGAITYYFRKTFVVPTNATLQNITLRLLRDDGALVYLNGIEISRQNMPPGPITYQTLASIVEPVENTFFTSPVPPEALVSGLNTIAVEVHQVSLTSSDVSFDLELAAASATAVAPIILSQPQSQTVRAGSNVTFRVDAGGTEPLRYRWRRNGVFLDTATNLMLNLLNGATNATLTLLNVQTNAAGTYTVLVSNSGGTRLSAPATLTLIQPNRPPIANDQQFTIAEEYATQITLASGDPDPGTILQYIVISGPAHGTLTPGPVPYLVTYSPELNFNGIDSFTWMAFDGELYSQPATATFTIIPVNDPPAARLVVENIVTFLDTLAVITLGGTVVFDGSQSADVDNDPLQYLWSAGDPPEAFAAGVRVTNEFASGTYQIVLEVSDGTALGVDTVNLDVLLPCDAINLLVVRIDEASLRRQTKRALIKCLHMACDAFQDDRVDRAIDLLHNFQGKVAAQRSEIDPVLADLLIGSTQTLIDALTPP